MAKGYHNGLNSMFLCDHPTMWQFLRGLVKDVAIHRLVLAQARVENNPAPRGKYQTLAERLSRKVGSYNNELDKIAYLRAVAHITSS